MIWNWDAESEDTVLPGATIYSGNKLVAEEIVWIDTETGKARAVTMRNGKPFLNKRGEVQTKKLQLDPVTLRVDFDMPVEDYRAWHKAKMAELRQRTKERNDDVA